MEGNFKYELLLHPTLTIQAVKAKLMQRLLSEQYNAYQKTATNINVMRDKLQLIHKNKEGSQDILKDHEQVFLTGLENGDQVSMLVEEDTAEKSIDSNRQSV